MDKVPQTSRELVDALARLSPINPGLKWLDDAKALIDAWVRVRETEAEYSGAVNHCADLNCHALKQLESSLATAHKQLENIE